MNHWMIFLAVWMMFAFCVVLFIRGATVRETAPDRHAKAPAASSDRDAFALGRARSSSPD
jgi:hypothetical protein